MCIGRQAQDAGDRAFGVGGFPGGLRAVGGQARRAGQRPTAAAPPPRGPRRRRLFGEKKVAGERFPCRRRGRRQAGMVAPSGSAGHAAAIMAGAQTQVGLTG